MSKSGSDQKYGKDLQKSMPEDNSLKLSKEEIKYTQQVIGSILYYTRTVDMMTLVALGKIAVQQATATKITLKKVKQLLDYLATSPDAKL